MQYVALLPLFLTMYLAATRSVQIAFLNVYLPVLLLFPDYFKVDIPVIHRFSQAAAIGIALFLRPRFKLSPMDFLIGGYILATFNSEIHNSSLADSISLLVNEITDIAIPYLFGKYLIEQYGARVKTARLFVLLIGFVAVVSPIELLTGKNYFFLLFYKFFEQWAGWIVQHRWGMARVAGPYGHAILCGCIFVCAILLQFWLHNAKGWALPRRFLLRPAQFSLLLLAVLCAGSFMTLSRAPWLGLALGLVVASVGLARNIVRSGVIALVLLVPLGSVVYRGISNYTNVSMGEVENEDQRNAVYRRNLLSVYDDFILRGGLWGWGRAHRPMVHGIESIDNEFLLETLMFGKVGVTLFSAIGVVAAGQLIVSAYSKKAGTREERMFRFTLAAIYVAISMSITTVFLGLQMMPVFFLFVGWGEGVVVTSVFNPWLTQKRRTAFAESHIMR